MWAIEDCRHVSRRLEQALLAAGERVVRVAPHRMGASRKGEREPGKSDQIDALAVARAVVGDGVEQFPVAYLDDRAMEIRLLNDHRGDLVAQRTRTTNRLRWHLLALCPDVERSIRTRRAQPSSRAGPGRPGVAFIEAAVRRRDAACLASPASKRARTGRGAVAFVLPPARTALPGYANGAGHASELAYLWPNFTENGVPGSERTTRRCGRGGEAAVAEQAWSADAAVDPAAGVVDAVGLRRRARGCGARGGVVLRVAGVVTVSGGGAVAR